MRKTMMTGIGLLSLPAMIISASAFAADDGSAASVPPAPQGPFSSRTMGQNTGGYPPMGFDPMNPAGVQGAPTVPPGPGHVMNNATGGGLGGGNEVDIQIRGRIQLNGKGAGNQGWGGNNAWQSMPYGMPYNHGYGAPYGTPFMQGYGAPQSSVPQTAPQAPAATPAPEAPAAPSTEAPAVQQPAAPTEPFSWAPKQGMSGPGGFYAQPKMPAAPQAQPQPQPQFQPQAQQMPQPQAAPAQPQMPAEPDWVKQQRAEAEKRQQEAQKRFEEMQKNNPYAQQNQGQAGAWGQPQGFRGFGMPFQHGYGGAYGAPFMAQPQSVPQPQAPAESGSAEN